MRVLGIDFESTGLDVTKDRITEIGLVLWDVPTKRPLLTIGIFYHDETYPPLSAEIRELTGITDELLREFGTKPAENLAWLEAFGQKHEVRYLVGHGSENFDRPLLLSELDRASLSAPWLRAIPWIDTRNDLPFKKEPISRKLAHLALDAGFLNPFSHRAVFDALTTLKVFSQYDFEEILEHQKIPFVTCRALVSFNDKQLAKDLRYGWEKAGDKSYPKFWVKRVKENQLDQEIAMAKNKGFEVIRID